jgi:hypothetical protein
VQIKGFLGIFGAIRSEVHCERLAKGGGRVVPAFFFSNKGKYGPITINVPKKAPQIIKNANNESPMAYRYRRAYDLLFGKEAQPMQQRILDVRTNTAKRDKDVDAFVQLVVELAESDKEL